MTPVSPRASTRSMLAPVRTSIPSRRSTSAISSDASGSSAPASRGPGSTMVTRAPKRAMTWPTSRPTDPPPATTSDAGTVSVAIAPRLVQCGTASEQRRDDGLLPGGEDEGVACRDRLAADLDRHGARHPGLAADEATPLVTQAIDGDCVVPEVGGLLPDARGHGRPVRRHHRGARQTRDAPPLGEEVGSPDHHFGGDTTPVGALAADQLGLNADDVESGFRQLLRHLFAAGAQPDDDGIDFHRSTTRPSW